MEGEIEKVEDKVEDVAEKAAECVATEGCEVVGVSPSVVPDALTVLNDLEALLATPQCQKLIADVTALGTDFAASAPAEKKE